MDLGTFSVSLAVKDMEATRSFYEKLGFELVPAEGEGGPWDDYEKNWVILNHGTAYIGLFHGMFEENLLTFNPLDVRAVQKSLKEQGVELTMEADEATTGPAAAMLKDPEGNQILLDQHND